MQAKRVTERCKNSGCLKIRLDGTCLVFFDPEFQWERFGVCWGFTDSLEEMLRIREATGRSNGPLNRCIEMAEKKMGVGK